MSRALAQLRVVLQDDLLVRVGQTMQPTSRAEELLAPLEELLERIRGLVATNEFDAAKAKGTFRVAALDILTYMLVPRLVRKLALEAPHVDVQIVQWNHRWREHLESGDVDLTIGQPAGQERGVYCQLLVRNTWACVLRRGPVSGTGWRGNRAVRRRRDARFWCCDRPSHGLGCWNGSESAARRRH